MGDNCIGSAGMAALFSCADSPALEVLDLNSQIAVFDKALIEVAVSNLLHAISRRPADRPLTNLSLTGYINRGRRLEGACSRWHEMSSVHPRRVGQIRAGAEPTICRF